MTNPSAEISQGNSGAPLPPPNSQPGPPEHLSSQGSHGNKIFKSGPLFISSKGIGWTSWKKRWFILTQTSLVFFRSDPSVVQKGNEVNLTLGGIDLNNSGSVVVKADKKLLTVQFPDVHDGRAFTLKAETTEDLYEWKTALENALAQAPSAANGTGQNGIFRNDQTDSIDISLDQSKDREPVKSTVVGRPVLLALEDVDGAPSFLEKALRFIEEHGAKVEGILRQAADVEDVDRRIREYEQGKVEFSAQEDAHVIGDCVKYVIRELPSSPVPASCCKALLEACRTERASRVSAMRAAICDTFPEPNRRLLQRILLMMQSVASYKAVNRMSSSAVSACMAPLLLRPLLAGDCQIENDFDVGGDGSVQLLQAAAAANHAQAIVITLLEEYNSIFGEGSVSPDIYTDSEEESGSESEEATDDDLSYDDDDYDDEQDESIQESDEDADDDLVSETYSGTGDSMTDEMDDDEEHDHSSSGSKSSGGSEDKVNQMISSKSLQVALPRREDVKSSENLTSPIKTSCADQSNKPADIVGGVSTDQPTLHSSNSPSPMKKSMTISNAPTPRRRTMLGRTSARKNLSMESIDYPAEDEDEIERLEAARTELQIQIAEEEKANAKLQSHMEKRKKALQDRHLALEQEVVRLQGQLQKEKNTRATLEAGLKFPPEDLSDLSNIDEKTKADLEELALVEVDLANLEQKVDELGKRLNLQLEQNYGSTLNICDQPQQISNHERKLKNKADTEVAATSQCDRSRSKDPHPGRAENDDDRQPESTPLPNKYPPTSSKKYGTRSEGPNSSTSALTKLTSRLNFLKVRRNQIANELQNMDKGRDRESSHLAQNLEKGKGSELHQPLPSPSANRSRGSEFHQPLPSPNTSRPRGSETHSVPNQEKGRGLDSSQSIDKGSGKRKSNQNSDKLRKSDSQPEHYSDGWNQNQQAKHLERGRSEGHQSYNVDKGR